MRPGLILILQPDTDLDALLHAIASTVALEAQQLYPLETFPVAGGLVGDVKSFALMPGDAEALMKQFHPTVTRIRRPL